MKAIPKQFLYTRNAFFSRKMHDYPLRWAWAEINLPLFRSNIKSMIKKVSPQSLWAVVKADAYGHGAVECAIAAKEAGATGLGVALVQEGIELRKAGIDGPILVMSEQPASQNKIMIENDLIATLYNKNSIEHYSKIAKELSINAKVHLKIDTGMHRVGAPLSDAIARVEQIMSHKYLHLDGIFSHMASADGNGNGISNDNIDPSVKKQATAFQNVIKTLNDMGLKNKITNIHLANSAATVRGHLVATDSNICNICRSGIAMYGINGDADSNSFGENEKLNLPMPLQPVMSLKARVSHILRVPAGEAVSYGLRIPKDHVRTVAAIPLGYADGVIRALWKNGYVLIGGKKRYFAGMVTMDQVLVDMGDDEVEIGAEVVLIGTQGEETIIANDWAKLVGTIGYEVTCGISARIPRVYLR
jgi:alanine racemase